MTGDRPRPARKCAPWKIAAAVTALQRAFPGAEVWWDRASRYGNGYAFRVRGRGALLVSPAVFERCADEPALETAISKGAERMAQRVNPAFPLELR